MSLVSVQPPKFLSSFGRNRGRSLRPYQQGLVDDLLPKLAVDLPEFVKICVRGAIADSSPPAGEATRFGGPLEALSRSLSAEALAKADGEGAASLTDPHQHTPLPSPPRKGEGTSPAAVSQQDFTRIALEIGFGGGEHLLAQAAHNPDTLFIGCEPFINGVAKCLAGIEKQGLKNIRLYTDDARKLIETLPDMCLDSVFILFPDPWPKARHNKRRLVNLDTLSMLARVHKPGGRLLLATDHVDYSVWMLEVLQRTPHYRWMAREQADWKTPPKDWTETKYQRKTTAEGRDPVFLECVRV